MNIKNEYKMRTQINERFRKINSGINNKTLQKIIELVVCNYFNGTMVNCLQ